MSVQDRIDVVFFSFYGLLLNERRRETASLNHGVCWISSLSAAGKRSLKARNNRQGVRLLMSELYDRLAELATLTEASRR